MVIELGLVESVGLAVIVIFIGKLLVEKISFLNKFLIPFPVVGGLIFALLTLVGYITGTFEIVLDTTLQGYFMTLFFTTVGFSASIKVLKQGGKGVVLFLLIASILVVLQNAIGAGVSILLGQDPLFGLATGSIPMTGGHGTSGAFGPVLEEAGLAGASTITLAAATFGLIAGSLIGGPLAKQLINKYDLKPSDDAFTDTSVEKETKIRELNSDRLSLAFFQIALAAGIGYYVSLLIAKTGLTMPGYIGGMLVAAVMTNVCKEGSKFEMKLPEINALSSLFLSIFLSFALMNLKLWQLAELAIPLIVLLACQVLLIYFFARFVTFNVMGRNYDAAVLSAGHCGFGLGATPNAMANMNAVTTQFGPSPTAYFILPIVGAMFIDFTNATIITMFLHLLS